MTQLQYRGLKEKRALRNIYDLIQNVKSKLCKYLREMRPW